MGRSNKLREFVWSIFLLIISLILFFLRYFKIVLLILFIVFLGFIIKIYILKKEIKLLSKKWINIYIVIMAFAIVVDSLIFGGGWRVIDVIFFITIMILIYLWFRFLNRKWKLN